MDEIVVNTAFSFTKKDIVRCGLKTIIDASVASLLNQFEGKFVDMLCERLQDEDNAYQIIFTIKPLVKE